MPRQKEPDKRQMNFWIDSLTAERLAAAVRKEETTMSEFIREAIAERLAKVEGGSEPASALNDAIVKCDALRSSLEAARAQLAYPAAPSGAPSRPATESDQGAAPAAPVWA